VIVRTILLTATMLALAVLRAGAQGNNEFTVETLAGIDVAFVSVALFGAEVEVLDTLALTSIVERELRAAGVEVRAGGGELTAWVRLVYVSTPVRVGPNQEVIGLAVGYDLEVHQQGRLDSAPGAPALMRTWSAGGVETWPPDQVVVGREAELITRRIAAELGDALAASRR
jgi:hypothetical protein